MEYRRLGSSGLKVSAVGLGTNNFGSRMEEKQSIDLVHHALDIGVNFIDTANIYGTSLSEQYIGKAIKEIRDKLVIATKVSGPQGKGPNDEGGSRAHIMREVENSLTRLQTDYIDLYQMHWWFADTPIEETLRALDDLVRQGKVRYIGCSNYTPWQICEAVWTSRTLHLGSFVSVQPEWSMLNREIEQELVPFSQAYNIGILPYFPLASGFLTGKYRRGDPIPEGTRFHKVPRIAKRTLIDRNFDTLERVERFAAEHGYPMVELAIAWLLYNQQVSSVIAGASTPEQLDANAKAAELHLTAEEIEELDGILKDEV
ncbi:MAG: aldo/keto reductase [Chloroflexi bacterium]|nr:aldo/keto reductase [Chloroflexota bacterium]